LTQFGCDDFEAGVQNLNIPVDLRLKAP
jgi:hypothetical protein